MRERGAIIPEKGDRRMITNLVDIDDAKGRLAFGQKPWFVKQ